MRAAVYLQKLRYELQQCVKRLKDKQVKMNRLKCIFLSQEPVCKEVNSQVLFLVDASLVRSLVDESVCGQASLHVMKRDFTLETFTQGPDTAGLI